jgi:hypothetical protein
MILNYRLYDYFRQGKRFSKKGYTSIRIKIAIHSVMNTGYYYSNHTAGKLANLFDPSMRKKPSSEFDAYRTGITVLKISLL